MEVFPKINGTMKTNIEFSLVNPLDLRNLANALNKLSFDLENEMENNAQLENEKH